jgi:hypothetical protein
MLVSIFAVTWWMYDFRYAATADGQPILSQPLVIKSVKNTIVSGFKKSDFSRISDQEFQSMLDKRVQAEDFPLPVKADLWMQAHHIFPEGWLYGFLYTYANTLLRSTYLLGNVAIKGTWTYFPLAIVFKTPAATLAAFVLVPLGWIVARRFPAWVESEEDENPEPVSDGSFDWWTLLVLTMPPGVYFVSALTTNLNLGLRHILPVYPYIFVGLGLGIAAVMRRWPIGGSVAASVLVMLLLTESIAAYPNYLAFFNVFSGGSEGGIRLLGDSNLDWGQDLPALAEWQKGHPTDKLYFSYFGMADPKAYGIDFVNLPGGWPFSPVSEPDVNQSGVIAISATNLQGIYVGQPMVDWYKKQLKGEKPFRILNGTIYLFSWPPRASEEKPN